MSRIDARSKSIRELLQGRRYAIDEYQREYKWDEKNIEELLDDLHAKFSSNYEPNHERHEVEQYDGYFLGSIILSRRQGKAYIVDGQQRLTSLTLLLIYLHHLQRNSRRLTTKLARSCTNVYVRSYGAQLDSIRR